MEKSEQSRRTQSRATMGRVVTVAGRVVTVAGREAGHRLALWGKAFQAEGTIGAETLRENALKQE